MIDTLCKTNKISICIHDIQGILGSDIFKIGITHKTHTKKFCDIAKSTERGFKLCIRCKTKSNQKAVFEQTPFCSHCPYGLFEYVYPVVFNGNTICIIYVGNIVIDEEKSMNKLRFAAKITGVGSDTLIKELKNAHFDADADLCKNIAEIISSYILLILNSHDVALPPVRISGCKSTTKDIIDYINLNFDKDISLKELAKLYFINEKYLGQILRRETGTGFRAYLNNLRLNNSLLELKNSDKSILNIAMESGFKNVTYFNQKFVEKFGISPSVYRLSPYTAKTTNNIIRPLKKTF